MALTEKTYVREVSVKPASNSIDVLWVTEVKRGEEVISEQFSRKAYSGVQRAEFEAEVDGAANYVNLIGWSVA